MLPLHGNDKVTESQFDVGHLYRQAKFQLRYIFSDSNSSKLFCFLILNFSFAFVELFFGLWTNCLGLISDSFHMFFDCTALLIGLSASLISRRTSTSKFTFGFGRVEIIAGFVNSLLLCFIAFYIFAEALERLLYPPTVKHEKLMLVSVLGFIINLIGIYVFHGDGGHCNHSHHNGPKDKCHSHQHNKPPKNIFSQMYETVMNGISPSNSSQKGIMEGVFLHIMADTLGSVGVIISSYLIENYGIMIADPLSTIIIAVLILLSVYSLLKQSTLILMQRVPQEIEPYIPGCVNRVQEIDGVVAITDVRFWTLCTNQYVGNLKVEVRTGANVSALLAQATAIFSSIGVKHLYIQTENTVL